MGEGAPELNAHGKGGDGEGLSRRDVLIGGGALAVEAVAGAGEARAQEPIETHLTPAQSHSYREGIARMQEEADREQHEIARGFVARADGSSDWVTISIRDSRSTLSQDSLGFSVNRLDARALERIREEARAGARVEFLHTHPTHFGSIAAPEHPDAERVPPSTIDILSSLSFTEGLDRQVADRITFKTVGETSAWRYGPSSFESGQRLRRALSAGNELLRQLNEPRLRASARSLGDALRRFARGLGGETERILGEDIPRMLRSDTLAEDLMREPGAVFAFARLEAEMQAIELPAEARPFIEVMQQASARVQEALREVDPNTDGRIFDVAYPGDFERYRNRWRGLGMDMEEEAHPAR